MTPDAVNSRAEPRAVAGPTRAHDAARYLVPLGRLLFVAIFLMSVPDHFASKAIEHAAAQGVPLAPLAVPASGVVALLGGLSVLFGYRARVGAWLLVLFLVPVTLMMHKFWAAPGNAVQIQEIMFMKNVSMLGGALLIAYFGAGPVSFDARAGRG